MSNNWLNRDAIDEALESLQDARNPDDAMAIYDKWLALKEAVRELNLAFAEAMVVTIKAQPDHEIKVGTKRYYVGQRRRTICKDKAATVQSLLELLGPDQLSECLKKQPFKPGTTRTALAQADSVEQYDQLFERQVVESVWKISRTPLSAKRSIYEGCTIRLLAVASTESDWVVCF